MDGLLALVVEVDDCGEERVAYATPALLARAGRSADDVHDAYAASALVSPALPRAARAPERAWAGAATLVCAGGCRQECVVVAQPLAPGARLPDDCGPLALWAVVRIGVSASEVNTRGGCRSAGGAAGPGPPSIASVVVHWRPLIEELALGAAVLPSAPHRAPAHEGGACSALDALLGARWCADPAQVSAGRSAICTVVARGTRALLAAGAHAALARIVELPDGELAVVGALPLSDPRGMHACIALLVVLPAEHVQTVGPYVLARRGDAGAPREPLLGEGSVAAVRAASRTSDGTRVALKSVDAAACSRVELERTWAEVAALALLAAAGDAPNGSGAHTRVNRLLGSITGPRYVHIALSCAPGVELHKVCAARDEAGEALPAADVRCLFAQLAAALDWLHACGVYHRDVKPQNVLVEFPSRTLTLVDFNCAGVGAPPRRNGGSSGARDDGGAKVYSPVHTPLYAAPELLAAATGCDVGYDPYKADVWGCACVLLQMLLAGDRATGGLVRPSRAAGANGDGGEDGPAGPAAMAAAAARLRATAGRVDDDGALRVLAHALERDVRARARMADVCADEYVSRAEAAPAPVSAAHGDGAETPVGVWRYGALAWRHIERHSVESERAFPRPDG